MRRFLMIICSIAVLVPIAGVTANEQPARTAERILETFVADFRHDPAAGCPILSAGKGGGPPGTLTFGIRVTGESGGDWHVVVSGRQQGTGRPKPAGEPDPAGKSTPKAPGSTAWEVSLKPGFPDEPIAYYALNVATLQKIDRGELNALTAMAKTHGGETAPLDVGVTPGFEPGPEFWAGFVPLSFHFWTRGLPERVPLGGEFSRVAHGANAVVLYYQKGFRSAWFQITKGQHINEDPQDQVNPFPSLFIMLRGALEARIGGRQLTLPAGEATFVPAGVTHEFWNDRKDPVEMILLMFGEGA